MKPIGVRPSPNLRPSAPEPKAGAKRVADVECTLCGHTITMPELEYAKLCARTPAGRVTVTACPGCDGPVAVAGSPAQAKLRPARDGDFAGVRQGVRAPRGARARGPADAEEHLPDGRPVIKVANIRAEHEHVAELRCEDCGGSCKGDRHGSGQAPDGRMHDFWTVTCNDCRKSWDIILSVPAPDLRGLLGL